MGHHVRGLIILVIFLSMTLIFQPAQSQDPSPMLDILDAMQQLLTGGGEYDRVYYAELRNCMDQLHPNLGASQDAAWQGFINYWLSNGTGTDTWGHTGSPYQEQNATNTEFLGMTIYEPCNYASNLAYYHASTEICQKILLGTPFTVSSPYVTALGKGFSALSMGSAFMHGSHTSLGHQQDNEGIKVIAYLVQQAMFEGIPEASSVLTDLSLSSRTLSAIEIEETLFQMYLTMPETEWFDYTSAVDVPDYYLSFTGVFTTVMTLAFEPATVDYYLPILCDAFGVPQEYQTFISDLYLPELRNFTGGQPLGIAERAKFIGNSLSTVGKLLYSFLWQEEFLPGDSIFWNETVIEMGYDYLPEFNAKMNVLNTFDQFEQNFQDGANLYPGDARCNPVSPHAMWHTQSAIGLLDFSYLGDEITRLLTELYNSNKH